MLYVPLCVLPWRQQLLQLVLQVVTLYYGGHLVISQEMSGGELVSLLLYQVSLAASLDVSWREGGREGGGEGGDHIASISGLTGFIMYVWGDSHTAAIPYTCTICIYQDSSQWLYNVNAMYLRP